MYRFIHSADWQIGKQFGQFEHDEAALLAEARFQSIAHLADLATARDAHFILVAGDVFDAQGVSDKTIHRLFHAMSAFRGPWLMIPGNHDAALAESVWTRAARLGAIPDHVSVCLRPEPCLLESLKVAVLPAPLTQRITHTDLTEWFAHTDTPEHMLRIGLAHGSVQGLLAEGIDASNPIATGRAAQARLDYLALGDWHGTRQIDAHTWYSGTPETDRFKANDSGQALWVEIDAPGDLPRVTPLRTGQYHWHTRHDVLNVPSDLDQTLQHLSSLSTRDVLELRVSGQIDLDGHRRLLATIEHARGKTRGMLTDLSALRLEPTEADIDALHASGWLGEVIRELQQEQNGSDAELARDALALLASLLEPTTLPADGVSP